MNIFDIIGHIKDPYVSPFIDYYLSDKSNHLPASTKFIDRDNDFLIGDSNGILMKIDFIFVNTEVYVEVANHFTKYNRYCDYKKGTIEYLKFWARELERRRNGMIANCKLMITDIDEYFNSNTHEKRKNALLKPVRITGTHYSYLNYSRIDRTQTDEEKELSKLRGFNPNATIEGFPRFWDGSYWKHKLDEFALDNMLNRCDSKARRKGFTFQESNDSAHTVNLTKGINIIHFAYDSDQYLLAKGKLTWLTKRNLDWYDKHTYWKRGFIKEELSNIITGFKKSKEGNKIYGFISSISSVGTRNTSSSVGATAYRIKGEESGANPSLQETVDITMSVGEVGANKVGNLCLFGTGGTKGANWAAFANIFFNPLQYNMLAMENIWDKNARHNICGFFFPQIWNYEPHIDKDGNSKLIDAYYVDKQDKDNKRKYSRGEELLIYLGQRANSPEEAFTTTIENIFTSDDLTNHIKFVRHSDTVTFEDGIVMCDDGKRYKFKTNEQLRLEGYRVHPHITDVPFKASNDNHGCLRIFDRPIRDIYGVIPDNVYFISYDTVRVNKETKDITNKHSLNSFKVWEIPNTYNKVGRYRIVASYCGRPNTLEEADKIALYTAEFYNARILFEYGSGETFINFKKWGKLDRLLKDPTHKIEQKQIKSDIGFGIVIGDSDKKLDGLTYLKEWLYEPIGTNEDGVIKYNLHYINDLSFLLELQIFDFKHNFDRISDAIVAIYKIKSISISKSQSIVNTTNKRLSLSKLLKEYSL